jgi:neutral ceramidase
MRALFLLLALSGQNSCAAGELRVGAASVVITPAHGTPLAGYYEMRTADAVRDDLYAKALVFEQDDARAAVVVCDLITLGRGTVEQARRLIEQATAIPSSNILIAATHTHTGPIVPRNSSRELSEGATNALAREFAASLPELIARSVREASGKLAPVRASATVGLEEQLSHNRRYFLRDGTVGWNPPKLGTNVVRPAGPIDPDVAVVYFESLTTNALATLVNFAMHPDTVGGTQISADYPGALARRLAAWKGPDMLTLFANGACGNINHRDLRWPDPQKGPAEAERLGGVLAGAVQRAWPRLATLTTAPRARSEMVRLSLPKITEIDLERARATVNRLADRQTKFLDKVDAFKVLDVAARGGKPWEVEVQVIALGQQVAIVGLPGEIFVELGLAIKKGSPFPVTVIAELANGSIGYIPNRSAYAEGNYEVISARCAEGAGELLAESAVKLLHQLRTDR